MPCTWMGSFPGHTCPEKTGYNTMVTLELSLVLQPVQKSNTSLNWKTRLILLQISLKKFNIFFLRRH